MPLKFEIQKLSDDRYESAEVFDVNNDGTVDIVSGAYWYEGPDFKKRHKIGDIKAEGEYFDDFSTVPIDINGDGYLDYVTGGWWGKTIRWRENPGNSGKTEWPEHRIDECGNVETTRGWDIDNDGAIEIIPNTPGAPLRVYKLEGGSNGNKNGHFKAYTIFNGKQGHGLGFGDISGSGRGDFVLAKGWLECPQNRYEDKWIWHNDFDLGSASIPIIVADINGDGHNDIIVGQSHAYGLDWWEQHITNGKRSWVKHAIDPHNSQYHDMKWIDIDCDGRCELVTGKRYRAHCGNDPGSSDPLGIYYFKWDGESFSKQVISYGPAGEGIGLGIHFAMADLTGNGYPDIVAPGKDGLYVLYNNG